MAGVTHNAGCFVGEAGSIEVQEGGERDTDDPTRSLHCALQGLAVGCSAAPVPHSDAARQGALDGASVEGAPDGWGGSLALFRLRKGAEAPLGLLVQ